MGFARKSYYEILDIDPSATSEEIGRAYKLVRGTFSPDSIATYSLYSPAESELIARKLEEAYQILTSASRRERYDTYLRYMEATAQGAGPLPGSPEAFYDVCRGDEGHEDDPSRITERLTEASIPSQGESASAPKSSPQKVELHPEIEREWDEVVETLSNTQENPMAALGLRPPVEATAAEVASPSMPPEESGAGEESLGQGAQDPPFKQMWSRGRLTDTGSGWRRPTPPKVKPIKPLKEEPVSPEEIFALEAAYGMGGPFFKALREKKGIPLSEIAQRTKIGTLYLENIESETFRDLPPAVYLRGFITHYVRLLKLDEARFVSAYMDRYEAATSGGSPV